MNKKEKEKKLDKILSSNSGLKKIAKAMVRAMPPLPDYKKLMKLIKRRDK